MATSRTGEAEPERPYAVCPTCEGPVRQGEVCPVCGAPRLESERDWTAKAGYWLLASAAGVVVGTLVLENLPRFNYFWAGAILGASVGAAQWLSCRKLFKLSPAWVVATAIGFAVGYAVSDPLHVAIVGYGSPSLIRFKFFLVLGVIGIFLGLFQCKLIRRDILRPESWVAITTLCWAAAPLLAYPVALMFRGLFDPVAMIAGTGLPWLALARTAATSTPDSGSTAGRQP